MTSPVSASAWSPAIISPMREYLDQLQLFLLARGPYPGPGVTEDTIRSPDRPFDPLKLSPEANKLRGREPGLKERFLFVLYQVVTIRYVVLPPTHPEKGGPKRIEACAQGGSWPIFTRGLAVIQIALLVYICVQEGLAPLDENGLIGPSFLSLINYGAPVPSLVKEQFEAQSWRLLTPPFLHAGFLHLLSNLSWQLTSGVMLERAWGSWRLAFIFLVSTLFGTLCSVQIRSIEVVIVGASGGVVGMMGSTFADHLINRRIIYQARWQLVFWVFSTALMLGIGLLPIFDNITHTAGFFAGVGAGLVAIPDLTAFDRVGRRNLWAYRIAGMIILVALVGTSLATLMHSIPWQCGSAFDRAWCCYLFLSLKC
ncbi:hypothetical protein H9P43_000773 [Blastocladiella emersonii ATCC 22665]|nr:hypothetical protein H9P43_000773 [Blastocladiella emersonii ATCC 22665]